MFRVIKIILLIFWLFTQATFIQAAGVLVKPSELNFALTAGAKASQWLTVENISDRPVLYHLYADELADQLIIEPSDFRLEVAEKQRLKVTLLPKRPGLGATNLSIVAQDLDRREFNVATGVKVPIAFEAKAAPKIPFSFKNLPIIIKWSAVVLLGLIIALLAAWLILRRRKKTWLSQAVDLLKHHRQPWWKKLL